LSAQLFSAGPRKDRSKGGLEESTWAFLDRTADPAFTWVRDLLEGWFAAYPKRDRADLRGRLTSGDDAQFHGAWFELYLHALHRSLGFVVEVHPEMDGAGTHPDFRVVGNEGSMLVEATIPEGTGSAGRDARRARVAAAIDRVDCADFGLLFDIETEGLDAPSMRAVRRTVERWLDSLDWQAERARQEDGAGLDALPTRTMEVGDWSFSFRAWPRAPEQRGGQDGAILAGPSDGGIFDHAGTLRDRLEQKAKKYGSVAEPVIVAVRLDGMAASDRDVRAALHGPFVGAWNPATDVVESTERRGVGLWHRDGTARNRQVAGVLVFDIELRPWSVGRQRPILWVHPDPEFPMPDLPWDVARMSESGIEKVAGTFDPADWIGGRDR
jgi:hypothetical protein